MPRVNRFPSVPSAFLRGWFCSVTAADSERTADNADSTDKRHQGHNWETVGSHLRTFERPFQRDYDGRRTRTIGSILGAPHCALAKHQSAQFTVGTF